jgi:hypothetical protein
MARRLWIPLVALLAALPAAAETTPAVVRPRFSTQGQVEGSGTAFFLPAQGAAGAVAVTAAHSIPLSDLGHATEVRFVLGGSGSEAAVSSRFFAPPGRSFSAPGGSLVDDYLVFALDAAPSGVRILQSDSRKPSALVGERVRVLGVPAMEQRDEKAIFGTVAHASAERIEVALDVPEDLRGWGGAPVLSDANGEVIGILQAAWPSGGHLRLGVAPIAGVLAAMAHPLDGGLGRAFQRYAAGGSAPAPASTASRARAPSIDHSLALPPDAKGGSLHGKAGASRTRLDIEVRRPGDGAVVSDPNGAFVSGRAMASAGDFKHFDVMLVIDTSGSTADMTGTDVNGNGVVGKTGLHGLFGATDPGDSILAAEVAAARRVIQGLDPRSTRVGLITFAGMPGPAPGTFTLGSRRPAAVTEQALTTDYARVQQALNRVLSRGSDGMTYMSEGVRMGIRELLGLRGSISTADPESEKVMLFFTDGTPTLPYDPMMEAANVETVLRAADSAKRAGIKIDSFAIGPEALQGPVSTVEMAARTGGRFTPVRNPGQLVDVVENVSLADIEKVEIRNLSNGQSATVKELNADGSFGALVPVATGKNRIDVVARASDGTEAHRQVTVVYAPDAPKAPYIAQRNRLLQRRLVELRRGRVALEQERAAAARKELLVQIDRERAAAEQRAAAQRKELQLEVENPIPGEAPTAKPSP